jgi:hypothetical protein
MQRHQFRHRDMQKARHQLADAAVKSDKIQQEYFNHPLLRQMAFLRGQMNESAGYRKNEQMDIEHARPPNKKPHRT